MALEDSLDSIRVNPRAASAADSAEKPSSIFGAAFPCKAAAATHVTPSLDNAASACPRAVLDTNVLLDWLVFANPDVDGLVRAISSGRIAWLSSEAVRAELSHVLARGVASAWAPDLAAIDLAHATHALDVAQPAPDAGEPRLRCTDGDDQKFIELALGHRAHWLVTRDRALLKLARKALPRGLLIVTPARWSLPG